MHSEFVSVSEFQKGPLDLQNSFQKHKIRYFSERQNVFPEIVVGTKHSSGFKEELST